MQCKAKAKESPIKTGVLETRTNDKKCPETDIQLTVNRMVAGSNPARGAIWMFASVLLHSQQFAISSQAFANQPLSA
jgi:hypothetical protein